MVQVQPHRHRTAGFTLVELLVVVSIIALLIAILLPSLQKAREQAKTVICQSRLRGCSTASFTYLSDWGKYPPSISNYADSSVTSVRGQRENGGIDWLGVGDQGGSYIAGNENDPQSGRPRGFAGAPKWGMLWRYTNNPELYLCSKDKLGPPENTPQGGGGNGKFSYSQFSNMGLREPEKIPSRILLASSSSRGPAPAPRRLTKRSLSGVPLFIEEHPFNGINGLYDGTQVPGHTPHMEGNFNFNTDNVVLRHGPFYKRPGIWSARSSAVSSFDQGATQIGFADGHVEDVRVNYGFTDHEVKPVSEGGLGLKGIPSTAKGLLYHYGIEYDVIKLTR